MNWGWWVSNSYKHDFWILLNPQFIIVFICISARDRRSGCGPGPRLAESRDRRATRTWTWSTTTRPRARPGSAPATGAGSPRPRKWRRRPSGGAIILRTSSQKWVKDAAFAVRKSEARSSIYEDKRAFPSFFFISYLLSQGKELRCEFSRSLRVRFLMRLCSDNSSGPLDSPRWE